MNNNDNDTDNNDDYDKNDINDDGNNDNDNNHDNDINYDDDDDNDDDKKLALCTISHDHAHQYITFVGLLSAIQDGDIERNDDEQHG